MTLFENRESTAEALHAHEEELRFKTTTRRNKLLGLWMAEQLGKTGDAAEAYAQQVVLSDFEEVGFEDVLRKLLSDAQAAGLAITTAEIQTEADRLLPQAHAQVMAA